MSRKPNAVVYIDGANMFYAQKKLGWNIDWERVMGFLTSTWTITDCRYYTGLRAKDEKMPRFLSYLRNIGLTVVTKPLKVIKIDSNHPMHRLHHYTQIYKSNFDVEITTDIILDAPRVNDVVLFSGDSDFEYLVKRLKALGKNITVFASRKTLSWELKLIATRYIYLEDYRSEIERI